VKEWIFDDHEGGKTKIASSSTFPNGSSIWAFYSEENEICSFTRTASKCPDQVDWFKSCDCHNDNDNTIFTSLSRQNSCYCGHEQHVKINRPTSYMPDSDCCDVITHFRRDIRHPERKRAEFKFKKVNSTHYETMAPHEGRYWLYLDKETKRWSVHSLYYSYKLWLIVCTDYESLW